jgi:trans-2-enoyl-CoA reductase
MGVRYFPPPPEGPALSGPSGRHGGRPSIRLSAICGHVRRVLFARLCSGNQNIFIQAAGVNPSQALVYREHGSTDKVLSLEARALPPVGPGMARIRMLAAVIHPSDFGTVEGSYGRLRELPAVAGREGVGEIVEIGTDVHGWQPGDRVRMPEEGAWQTEAVAPAAGLWPVPTDIPVDLAAMAFINPPTAWRLLRDAHLQEGDWIVQNAANSAVGQFVIRMARHLRLKTLNIVRRPELVESLGKLGADVVVLEDSGYEKRARALTGDGSIRLALNSVGGESAIRLLRCLDDGGVHITFGAMAFEQVRFPTRQLIFNRIEMRGFWLDKWYRDHSRERAQIMFDRIFALMRSGELPAPVAARFPLDRWRDALAAARAPKSGKVLLLPPGA